MTAEDDEETVTITAVRPYGYLVLLADGTEGLIDIAKTPSWARDQPAPVVGDRFLVTVLDSSRSPRRLSALPRDIEIARRRRGRMPDALDALSVRERFAGEAWSAG